MRAVATRATDPGAVHAALLRAIARLTAAYVRTEADRQAVRDELARLRGKGGR